MKRLKVLHLITTLPRLSGAGDNTRHTVNLLDPNRYEVHLACGPAELDTSRVASHVSVMVIGSLVRPVALISDLRATWDLFCLFRRERYDIVHTHNAKAGVLGRVAARLADVPIAVHTAHSISFAASASRLVNSLYRLVDRASARLCAKIVTVSKVNTTTYLDARIGHPEQYVTIYSGVETRKYLDRSQRSACRAELGIGQTEILVLWIGRLNRQKDPVTYVRAAKLLSEQFPHVCFAIAGEDPVGDSVEPELKKEIEQSQLGSKVRLLGYRSDIERLLAAADLVMHTSLYEGLGRSVIETMLSGVPLVATSVDGVPEAVVSGERGGLLVSPRNPRALADAAAQLIGNPRVASRLAAAGQSWAMERFDVRDMVTAIDQLYQQLWQDNVWRRA